MILSELLRFRDHLVALFFVELNKTVLKAPIETKKALIVEDFAIGLYPLIIWPMHLLLEFSSQLIHLFSEVVEDFRALVLSVVLHGGIITYFAHARQIDYAFLLRGI